MTWFIIFVILLGARFAPGDSVKTQHGTAGSNVKLEVDHSGEVTKCELITNNGTKTAYEPGAKTKITDRVSPSFIFFNSGCSVNIHPAEMGDVGRWTVISYRKDGSKKEESFKLHMKQEVSILPYRQVLVSQGYYVYAKLDVPSEGITECSATYRTYDESTKYDLFNIKEEGLELYGDCGFRLLANTSHGGTWNFEAMVNEDQTYFGSFHLQVTKKTEKPEEMEVIDLQIGAARTIDFARSSVFCQLETPAGVKLPMKGGACNYHIPTVTSAIEGVWIARYGMPGEMEITVQKFRVVTHEWKTVTTNVTYAENGEIKLLCHVKLTSGTSFDYCRFTKPSGEMLNLSPAIGTNDYTSFKVSQPNIQQTNYYCGLVIHKPQESDYGTWKCGMSYSRHAAYTGSLLYVGASNSSEYNDKNERPIVINADPVYVKRGDPCTMKCVADAPLDYCWIRSPNGTSYSVSTGKIQSNYTLQYEGAGLSFGECGVKIENAAESDAGQWTCHLGIMNSTEENKAFPVYVMASYLIPDETDVLLGAEATTVLSCSILPGTVDKGIKYCRWIRPDGYGIHNGVSHRYAESSNKSACVLTILNDQSEDIGLWTCVAGLSGNGIQESWSHVKVRKGWSTMGSIVGTILTACIFVTIAICVFLVINIRRRRRMMPKQPPAYSADVPLPPKSLNPHYVSKEFQY